MPSILVFPIIFLLALPSLAMLDPVDFLVLQSVKKHLRDLPGSDFFAGWDFTSDPCDFQGVVCRDDRVVSLSLGDPRAGSPGLTGRLDPSVSNLAMLTRLSVVPGQVFGSIPDTLSRCSELTFLALSKNYLSGPIPSSLGSLLRLHTLDLSFNILSGPVPASFCSNPSLSNLILSHNRFSGPLPSFSHPSLLHLDLKHNELSGFIPNLPSSLHYLSLSSNSFTGPIEPVLCELNRLNFLDLAMNKLTGRIPSCVFSFPLESLQLQRNLFVGEVRPEREVRIPVVDLSFNRLSGSVSLMILAAEEVRRLYLNNNMFGGEVPAKFGSIRVLCLQYNCMAPPEEAMCPMETGTMRMRPTDQCQQWREMNSNGRRKTGGR